MSFTASGPIGVFDSGLGGLTVVRQIRRILPSEEVLYLGDLAHLPYGTKSAAEIRRRSEQCARFLLKRGIKALVIACNSASSVAFTKLRKTLPVPVLDVITPAVESALSVTRNYRIGVIATYATIESGSYTRILRKKCPEAEFFMKPCPLFVPLAEEGWLEDAIAAQTARKYLLPIKRKSIDTLILGCTHYPLLQGVISRVMGRSISLIDSAVPTALRLKALLQKRKMSCDGVRQAHLKICITDYVRNFTRIGEAFLGESLEHVRRVRIS